VLPWSAWLERSATHSPHSQLHRLRRLGATEEWLLWREAAAAACTDFGLLAPEGLADALRRSVSRMRDWDLSWPGTPTPESAVLQLAARHFSDSCARLGAYSVADWPQVLQGSEAESRPLLFAGFDELGPRLRARLEQLNARFAPAKDIDPEPVRFQVQSAADPADELQSAARWCREQLERNPAARLLVVDTRLRLRRAQAVQAFEHVLHGGALLDRVSEALFAIEGGQPFVDFEIVRAAIAVLKLCGRGLDFPELSSLLRSPYIGCGTLEQRALLELELRERNVAHADFARLCELARQGPSGSLGPLADVLGQLAPALSGISKNLDHAAGWAREFASRLEATGWPGDGALGSDEQQQCERFRDLLGEMSTLGATGKRWSYTQALELLRAMAARIAFEAATPDVPVTLTESLDDPLVTYDGIWVAGLSADQWPAPARADPFIPIVAQREAGLPGASAEAQLQRARHALTAWQRCATQLVLSWPEGEGDVSLQPSPLLAVPARAHRASEIRRSTDPLLLALQRSAVREPRAPDRALPWTATQRLAGGIRALQLQVLCPFKAVAEHRLRATALSEPSPGLDRRERGSVLHRALELVYRQLKDSQGLTQRAADGQLEQLAAEAGAQAMQELLARRAERLPAALASNESARLARLVGTLLRQELERAAAGEFAFVQIEESQEREIAGLPLRIRMDRLDRLADGRVVVIDYKSGRTETFRPLDERPRQVQLLAYAMLAAGEVAGVAAVHLGSGEVAWRGAAAEPGLLPKLPKRTMPTAPWPELMGRWRQVVETLVRDFAAGVSTVDPLPGACRVCQLPAFCRVTPGRLDLGDPDAEEGDEESEAVHGR